jgi:hypothetical protein
VIILAHNLHEYPIEPRRIARDRLHQFGILQKQQIALLTILHDPELRHRHHRYFLESITARVFSTTNNIVCGLLYVVISDGCAREIIQNSFNR